MTTTKTTKTTNTSKNTTPQKILHTISRGLRINLRNPATNNVDCELTLNMLNTQPNKIATHILQSKIAQTPISECCLKLENVDKNQTCSNSNRVQTRQPRLTICVHFQLRFVLLLNRLRMKHWVAWWLFMACMCACRSKFGTLSIYAVCLSNEGCIWSASWLLMTWKVVPRAFFFWPQLRLTKYELGRPLVLNHFLELPAFGLVKHVFVLNLFHGGTIVVVCVLVCFCLCPKFSLKVLETGSTTDPTEKALWSNIGLSRYSAGLVLFLSF